MTKHSRVTNVQTPGEQPAAQPEAAAAQPAAQAPSTEAAKPEVTTQTTAAAPTVDLDALRAQIRAEEQARAREELGQQIAAAASVVSTPDQVAATPRGKGDYATMRAADVDATTLTAPVLTRDGWVCPPAPQAKK